MNEMKINQIDIEKYLSWFYAQQTFNLKRVLDVEKEELDKVLSNIELNDTLNSEQKDIAKDAEIKRYNIIADNFCSMTSIWIPPTEKEKQGMCYIMDITLKMKMDALDRDLASRGIQKELIIEEHLERTLSELCSNEYKGLLSHVIGGMLVDEFYKFAAMVGLIRFAKYADDILENKDNDLLENDDSVKIEKSYIERVRELERYGFFNLEKVKELSIQKQSQIVAYIMDGKAEYTRKVLRIVLGLQR